MFMYRILIGQAYVGPKVDNETYPGLEVSTIEEWMKGLTREDLSVSWEQAADKV